jgi:hypothetical protein
MKKHIVPFIFCTIALPWFFMNIYERIFGFKYPFHTNEIVFIFLIFSLFYLFLSKLKIK